MSAETPETTNTEVEEDFWREYRRSKQKHMIQQRNKKTSGDVEPGLSSLSDTPRQHVGFPSSHVPTSGQVGTINIYNQSTHQTQIQTQSRASIDAATAATITELRQEEMKETTETSEVRQTKKQTIATRPRNSSSTGGVSTHPSSSAFEAAAQTPSVSLPCDDTSTTDARHKSASVLEPGSQSPRRRCPAPWGRRCGLCGFALSSCCFCLFMVLLIGSTIPLGLVSLSSHDRRHHHTSLPAPPRTHTDGTTSKTLKASKIHFIDPAGDQGVCAARTQTARSRVLYLRHQEMQAIWDRIDADLEEVYRGPAGFIKTGTAAESGQARTSVSQVVAPMKSLVQDELEFFDEFKRLREDFNSRLLPVIAHGPVTTSLRSAHEAWERWHRSKQAWVCNPWWRRWTTGSLTRCETGPSWQQHKQSTIDKAQAAEQTLTNELLMWSNNVKEVISRREAKMSSFKTTRTILLKIQEDLCHPFRAGILPERVVERSAKPWTHWGNWDQYERDEATDKLTSHVKAWHNAQDGLVDACQYAEMTLHRVKHELGVIGRARLAQDEQMLTKGHDAQRSSLKTALQVQTLASEIGAEKNHDSHGRDTIAANRQSDWKRIVNAGIEADNQFLQWSLDIAKLLGGKFELKAEEDCRV